MLHYLSCVPLAVRRAHVHEIVRVESPGGRTRLGGDRHCYWASKPPVPSVTAATLTVAVPTKRLRAGRMKHAG